MIVLNQKAKKMRKKKLFEKIVALYPVIMILVSFLSDCYKVFDDYSVVELDSFITKYKSIEIAPLAQYASGLLNDYEAVKNSLIYKDISNGPIEGINSRRAQSRVFYSNQWKTGQGKRSEPCSLNGTVEGD